MSEIFVYFDIFFFSCLRPYIENIECEIQKEEICQRHDPRLLQLGYRVLATVREVCSEDTLLHAGENILSFIPF